MDGRFPKSEQRRVDACAEDVENVLDPRLSCYRESPQVSATDHRGTSAERKRFDDICPAPDAPVEQNLHVAADSRCDRWKDPDRGWGPVKVVTSMVRDGNGGKPGLSGPEGIVYSAYAFEQKGARPSSTE